MAVIAIRKTNYDGLTARNKSVLNKAEATLQLGYPTIMKEPSGALWMCWDDGRITMEQIALLGAIAANWQRIPNNYVVPADKQKAEDDIRAFIGTRYVDPATLQLSGEDNLTEILVAQGAPSSVMQAFVSMPATWEQYEPPAEAKK